MGLNDELTIENAPYFFIITDNYVIGTPRGIAESDRSFDIGLNDLIENYDLQTKLHLASAVFLRPAWNPPISYPKEGEELYQLVASYLSAFANDPKGRQVGRDYLLNSGLVRILVNDDELLGELRELI